MAEQSLVVYQKFTQEQIAIMQKTVAAGTSKEEFALFLEVCKHRGLNPFNREIYAIMRGKSMTIQIGIDGLRKLAERSGKYKGQLGPYWCGADGAWKEEWLESAPPVAAKVGILRSDFEKPIWAVARYASYVQPTNPLWQKMPENLLAKCAEGLAIRRTFPGECGGLYSHEEMLQAGPADHDIVGVTIDANQEPLLTYLQVYELGLRQGEWKNPEDFAVAISVVLKTTIKPADVPHMTQEQLQEIYQSITEERPAA